MVPLHGPPTWYWGSVSPTLIRGTIAVSEDVACASCFRTNCQENLVAPILWAALSLHRYRGNSLDDITSPRSNFRRTQRRSVASLSTRRNRRAVGVSHGRVPKGRSRATPSRRISRTAWTRWRAPMPVACSTDSRRPRKAANCSHAETKRASQIEPTGRAGEAHFRTKRSRRD